MISPAEFYAVGERLTKALVSGDFEIYQSVMDLPLQINPELETAYTLDTVDELRSDFEIYHQVNVLHHVTDIYRQIKAIKMLSQNRAAVSCTMELLSHSGRLVDPFLATHFLHQRPKGWRIYRIDSSVGHINWTLKRTQITPDGKFQSDGPKED